MQADIPAAGGVLLALAFATSLTACVLPLRPAAPPQAPPPPTVTATQVEQPRLPPPPAAATAPAPAPAPEPVVHPAETVLGYADRVRSLSAADLAPEIQRLGDAAYAPVPAMQLALALNFSRNPANAARAQSLLQRVQQDPEARPLHALARLLAAQFGEQRRLEEQAERQAQQVRDSQRRIEQLNDRLEAVRAIERSLPTQPRHDAPAPAPRSSAPRASAP